MATWISAIPFEDWPQQTRINGRLRPAMVTDLQWHEFGEMAVPVETGFGRIVWRALSCVMPGHSIERHTDECGQRVHIPLLTNPKATFNGEHMPAGFAYEIDPRQPHEIRNDGGTPRVHFIFELSA